MIPRYLLLIVGLTLGSGVSSFAADIGQVSHFVNGCPSGWVEAKGQNIANWFYGDNFPGVCVAGFENLCNSSSTWSIKVHPGGTTWNYYLPDLRGEFIRGFDNGRGVDSGRVYGSTQTDSLISHSHTAVVLGPVRSYGPGSYGTNNYSPTTITTSGQSPAGGTETRPRNVALSVCVFIGSTSTVTTEISMSSVTIVSISTSAIQYVQPSAQGISVYSFLFGAFLFGLFVFALMLGRTA